MRFHPGDEVTVVPAETDDYILNFQRFATVSRVVDGGVYVHLPCVYPPGREFGPIPPSRLLPGHYDENGEPYRW